MIMENKSVSELTEEERKNIIKKLGKALLEFDIDAEI